MNAARYLPTADNWRAWAASGRHLFACWPSTKTPATAHGFQDATTDAAQLQRYAVDYPGCNWAACPGMGGEVVLDFDPFKSDQAGGALAARLDGATAQVATPARGAHYWFKLPPGLHLGNGAGSLPRGWDVRAHNGYVLTVGATVRYLGDAAAKKGVPHGYTGRYELLCAGPVAELPADLLTLILQPGKVTKTNEAHKPGAVLGDFQPVQKSPVLTDGGVLAVCRGLPSGAKFARLWAGNVTGYASTSEAVKALVNYLTYVSQDPAQVDRLFRQSELCKLYERWGRLAQHEILESLATRRAWWHCPQMGA